jgi:1-acyl-sn-glycerol-3-phosphate acyltransferase
MAVQLRPVGGYGFLSKLCAVALRAFGWRIEVLDPMPAQCVIIMYPHTSNWDFVIGLATKWSVGLNKSRDALCFAGKESLFRAPWGWFFRAVGGFPVNRSGGSNFVPQMTARFANEPVMRFVLSPEGTRSFAPHMRSSFYYVAKSANVPVILGAFDFPNKRVVVTEIFRASDDVVADLARIDAYYTTLGNRGAKPENPVPWLFKK